MAVKLIKLLSGEDIVAHVISEDMLSVSIKEPIQIMMIPPQRKDEPPKWGMAPWNMLSESNAMIIQKTAIVAMGDPKKELHNNYVSAFGGGIVLPTAAQKLKLTETVH